MEGRRRAGGRDLCLYRVGGPPAAAAASRPSPSPSSLSSLLEPTPGSAFRSAVDRDFGFERSLPPPDLPILEGKRAPTRRPESSAGRGVNFNRQKWSARGSLFADIKEGSLDKSIVANPELLRAVYTARSCQTLTDLHNALDQAGPRRSGIKCKRCRGLPCGSIHDDAEQLFHRRDSCRASFSWQRFSARSSREDPPGG